MTPRSGSGGARSSSGGAGSRGWLRVALLVGALPLALSAVAAPASATEPASAPSRAAGSTALRAEIARARAADATSFVRVDAIASGAADAHAAARGHRAAVARSIAQLGPSAVLPVLELLADGGPRGVPAAMAPIVRRDLIEAAGLLRDARALAVLGPILADAKEDAASARTVAEAVARIGGAPAETQLLSALAAAAPERARAIVAGMGECRRLAVTQALARQAASTDDAMARAAARALGRAGNAWAWKTLPDRTEEARIREVAARALVAAYVQHEGEARAAASNALMVVDAPVTPALIADARRAATPATQAALDALARRLAANPAR
ncbi:MAG: hypothetical protein KIT84_34490 [Labilithrix sp.]|nr:hypothetical protein [Labilithrix sp.]MCW5816157.1 hypothetical protein [Labilithrix sp.]